MFIFYKIKKIKAFLWITFVCGLQIKFHVVLLLKSTKKNLTALGSRNREMLKCLDRIY